MSRVSVIVPSRNEKYLSRMVDGVFASAAGDIEVIVVVDGPTEYPIPAPRPGLVLIERAEPLGMRIAVNDAAEIATGDYLMKVDAHCLFAPGFDEVLKADCDGDWLVVPRRYSLDVETWERIDRMGIDYHYLSCPWSNPKVFIIQSCPWTSRTKERESILIDETMSLQGSCWFTTPDHFHKRMHGLERTWGKIGGECVSSSVKTWLSGGKVMVNKKTWYAHWHKAYQPRGYPVPGNYFLRELEYVGHYFADNQWPYRIHDFQWLIERFWPLPMDHTKHYGEKYTWPENWREYYG